MKINRRHLADLRGASRMVCDATVGITDLVEEMHRTIQLLPGPTGSKSSDRTSGITGLVYRSIRGSARLIGRGIDASLGPISMLLPDGDSGEARDGYVSALNGVCGDYLARTSNPFEISMGLRQQCLPIDPENPAATLEQQGRNPTGKLLVLIHGLCMNDRQWHRGVDGDGVGHDHGAALATELAYTPVYLRYNSGLPIAANGRLLSALLEQLIKNWPHPLEELVIIGHSMGGLVTRSACHYALEDGHTWIKHLDKLVFLGTPHHGAPLERGGQGLDFLLKLSPYSAPFTRIAKTRSAGITDLRHGNLTDDPEALVPLPRGVACYAIAASLAAGRSKLRETLVGDGLVPVNSALGIHRKPSRNLLIPPEHQWVGYSMGHLELLNHPEVYKQLRQQLE